MVGLASARRTVVMRDRIVILSFVFMLLPLKEVLAQESIDISKTQQQFVLLENSFAPIRLKFRNIQAKLEEAIADKNYVDFGRRVEHAEVLFLLEDYSRASVILSEAVELKEAKSSPEYDRALYYLGESLFQIGNDSTSNEFFQLLARESRSKFKGQAIRRLIDIAERRQKWEGVDEYITILLKMDKIPPLTAYYVAKNFALRGHFGELDKVLALIPADHEVYHRSRYVKAVAHVKQGELDAAAEIFAELGEIEGDTDDITKLRELAIMNRARLYAEQGKLAESMDVYQNISRASPFFDDALYEITWSYVREADKATDAKERAARFEKALQALEILLLAVDSGEIRPEAKLLFGNILVRLKRYEDADSTFATIGTEYAPLRDKVLKLSDNVDLRSYFEQIRGENDFIEQIVPPEALHWVSDREALDHAMLVNGELDTSQQWVEESYKIIADLIALIESEKRVQLFPSFYEVDLQAMELELDLMMVTRKLLLMERAYAKDELNPASALELKRILAERAELEPEYQKLAKVSSEQNEELSRHKKRLSSLQQQSYKLKYDVTSIRAQLRALEHWLKNNPDAVKPKQEKELRAQLVEQYELLSDLENVQADLSVKIEFEQDAINRLNNIDSGEDEIRARYAANVEQEQAILADAQNRMGAKNKYTADQIKQKKTELANFYAELEGIAQKMRDSVALRATALKSELLKEQGLLNQWQGSLSAVQDDTQALNGEIAASSLQRIAKNLDTVLLRADLGSCDIAWSMKEDKTKGISAAISEQRDLLMILENEFQEVLTF